MRHNHIPVYQVTKHTDGSIKDIKTLMATVSRDRSTYTIKTGGSSRKFLAGVPLSGRPTTIPHKLHQCHQKGRPLAGAVHLDSDELRELRLMTLVKRSLKNPKFVNAHLKTIASALSHLVQ